MQDKNEVIKLAYELTYHKYLLNKDHAQNLFTELGISEYIALHRIARVTSDPAAPAEKTYLKDLAEQLEMTMSSVSQMVGKLRDKGLVLWSHSGNGSNGTYVVITDSGLQAMRRQEEILNDYYSRVIDKFGHDNLVELLELMGRLEQVMNEEFTEKGADSNGSDTTE